MANKTTQKTMDNKIVEVYESPEVKVVLAEVEQGFAVSGAGTEQYSSVGTFSF